LVSIEKGETGLKILKYCRENYQGRGELCLLALNIPYLKWADKLNLLPLKLIKKDLPLVQKLRQIKSLKVVYTGSPKSLTLRMLKKVGFKKNDFDDIIAWEKSELYPIKWSCSPFIYKAIADKFSIPIKKMLVIGDNPVTDLIPAEKVGISTKNISEIDLKNI